jgi:hypothetical protein
LYTLELLQQLVRKFPEHAAGVASMRPLTQHAQAMELAELAAALAREEETERERDRLYWAPLRQELEQLRRSRDADQT